MGLLFCLQESAEHYNYMLSQRTQEIQELRKQLSDKQQHLNTVEKQFSSRAQDGLLESAEYRVLLDEKECLITVSGFGILTLSLSCKIGLAH